MKLTATEQSHMSKIEPNQFLKSIYNKAQKLCFYPSCGSNLLWSVMDMSADIFIFSDYAPKTSQDFDLFYSKIENDFQKNDKPIILIGGTPSCRIFKSGNQTGFIFFTDNNQVLSYIENWGCTINTFIGITDGCGEGGNYECVNDEPFLRKVLKLKKTHLDYFTDHSPFLENDNERKQRGHRFFSHNFCLDQFWNFELKNVLVAPASSPYSRFHNNLGDLDNPLFEYLLRRNYPNPKIKDLTAFNPLTRNHTRDKERCEILKLSPFRIRGGEIIAHYKVL
jgi:hypothetical protein